MIPPCLSYRSRRFSAIAFPRALSVRWVSFLCMAPPFCRGYGVLVVLLPMP
nr:MAG TPA: hypothetical protein [Caudoviricetes sp.]